MSKPKLSELVSQAHCVQPRAKDGHEGASPSEQLLRSRAKAHVVSGRIQLTTTQSKSLLVTLPARSKIRSSAISLHEHVFHAATAITGIVPVCRTNVVHAMHLASLSHCACGCRQHRRRFTCGPFDMPRPLLDEWKVSIFEPNRSDQLTWWNWPIYGHISPPSYFTEFGWFEIWVEVWCPNCGELDNLGHPIWEKVPGRAGVRKYGELRLDWIEFQSTAAPRLFQLLPASESQIYMRYLRHLGLYLQPHTTTATN